VIAARVIAILIALLILGLVAAYVFSGDKKYLSMAKRLGVAVALLLFVFFAVLIIQNWG
jgi:uncharacterized protein YyaL (SSP411 family)